MIVLALLLMLAAVLAFHGWTERRNAVDRNRLIAALVAKNAQEYAGLITTEEPRKSTRTRQLEDADFQLGSS